MAQCIRLFNLPYHPPPFKINIYSLRIFTNFCCKMLVSGDLVIFRCRGIKLS
uniref:Uncharacterized protein n=1 Tax=Anguilla anguilla TaxID=7936 RepID=A0A0E9U5G7_ANGAN